MRRKRNISIELLGAILLAPLLAGCANLNVAQEAGVVTALGGRSPSNEIQQIYYLGVFDPREQVPPTIYRVRVVGQAATLSNTSFASGWVPASIADSLSGQIGFDTNGQAAAGNGSIAHSILEGRSLMAFGPEGFRKAPRDHRLVIVMGANPEAYFSSVDKTLGTIGAVRDAKENNVLARRLLGALTDLRQEEAELDEIAASVPSAGGS
tara:strand:- start:12916 stop:13542 length:627 start_codon:yes stop_codon:yes gene_type:complete